MGRADKARSLLFLSCDLVGSTEYKQQNPKTWQSVFLTFYREFPQMLGDLAVNEGFHSEARRFILWKAIGDELIFTVDVTSEFDVYDAVDIWVRAMDQYEREVLVDVRMGTKGGAFIATFPGPDSEATVPRDPAEEESDMAPIALNDKALKGQRRHRTYLYDYFGPSIDTGFRVIGACTPRHFTLSTEVALALLIAHRDDKVDRPLTAATFFGLHSFKGVWAGRDYPLFALDRHCDDPVNTAVRQLTDGHLDIEAAIDVCRGCLDSEGWMSGIYLRESGHDFLKREPDDPLAEVRNQQYNEMIGSETMPPGEPSDGEPLDPDRPFSA